MSRNFYVAPRARARDSVVLGIRLDPNESPARVGAHRRGGAGQGSGVARLGAAW